MSQWLNYLMAILYGINSVLEALRAPEVRVERLCVQRGQKNSRIQRIVDLSRQKDVALSFEEKAWLDRKSRGARHQGVLCYVAEMETRGVEEILRKAIAPGLLVVLDGIEDPHNLGAILRSAEVAGADGVFLPRRRSAGLTAAAIKASAGAAAHIHVARIPNTAQLLDLLKEQGYWVAGLDPNAGQPLWETDFTGPTVLVLGNEAGGLHRLVKEKCDYLVGIPIRGRVRSHNVSVAAGIVLYEVLRQRSSRGISRH